VKSLIKSMENYRRFPWNRNTLLVPPVYDLNNPLVALTSLTISLLHFLLEQRNAFRVTFNLDWKLSF